MTVSDLALDAERERLRPEARRALGIGVPEAGADGAPSLRAGIAASGVGWYPLVVLSLLVLVDEFQAFAFAVLGPEIGRSLGIDKSGIAALSILKTLAITLAALPMAAYVQRRPRRGLVSIVAAFVWSVVTIISGFVVSALELAGVLVADGASTGSVRAVHQPLLLDSYPPAVRARALSFFSAGDAVGKVLAPLLVGGLTAWAGLSWRGVFVVMGSVCLLTSVISSRLRDPGYGRWDTSRLRRLVHGEPEDGAPPVEVDDDPVATLRFGEVSRRLFLIPTIRRLLGAFAVLGMLLLPLSTFLFFFLEERWGMGPGARSLFYAAMPLFSITALALFGKRADRRFSEDPASLVRQAAAFLAAGVLCLVASVLSPVFVGLVVLFGAAFALFGLMVPCMSMVMLSIVPATMRPQASALAGIFTSAVGGLAGLLLLDGIDRRFGTAVAMATLAVPGLIAAAALARAADGVEADLDQMIDAVVEDEELRQLRAAGTSPPLLACRGISFSYGQVQVLFDVDFTVDQGEMVALLGTNGAGKSTLLRVISGLSLPNRGSVRLDGTDVTYVDAERRMPLGVLQIPGGKAVFGPMTVVENLRVHGTVHGRDRARVEAGIDASFAAFPRLAERRDQQASSLSGGEQQMLALSKALIVQPRLLLIDELSLGLAPKVVAELLEMVRTIHAGGTSVVLVEQSVNIALSLVDHAYFMERGEIRFDGRADELIGRDDLLRSVFLEGANKGLVR